MVTLNGLGSCTHSQAQLRGKPVEGGSQRRTNLKYLKSQRPIVKNSGKLMKMDQQSSNLVLLLRFEKIVCCLLFTWLLRGVLLGQVQDCQFTHAQSPGSVKSHQPKPQATPSWEAALARALALDRFISGSHIYSIYILYIYIYILYIYIYI